MSFKYIFPRYPGFREKAVTFSFDDGFVFDKQLVDVFNRRGLKGTFNLQGDCYDPAVMGTEKRLTADELRSLYFPNGHEVAAHGECHRALSISTALQGITEVAGGRRLAEQFYGRIIRGFAYPDRSGTNAEIQTYLRQAGIVYARCGGGSGSFDLPENWLYWRPTAKHDCPELTELADKFLAAQPSEEYCAMRDPLLFYVWGHSFELPGRWEQFEAFCDQIGGRDDIWYATNMQIYECINAFRSLVFSADDSMVCNPTLIPVECVVDGRQVRIEPGETVRL